MLAGFSLYWVRIGTAGSVEHKFPEGTCWWASAKLYASMDSGAQLSQGFKGGGLLELFFTLSA